MTGEGIEPARRSPRGGVGGGARVRSVLWRVMDCLARAPRVWAVVPSLVLAASVGYLLEQAILEGGSSLWVPPNVWLTTAGVLAGLLSAVLWGAGHASGARRGAFLHAVADDRQPRHVAEDAMLRSTVMATWPRAVVMPFRPVPLDRRDWQRAAVDLSATIREQVDSAVVANPGIRGISILPGGPPHVLVLAGALAECALRDVGWPIRLIADDTSDVAKPFVEFELPRGQGSDDLNDAGGSPDGVLLLLKESGDTAVEDSIRKALGEQVRIRPVRFAHPIDEKDEAYLRVLGCFVEAVNELRRAGVERVYVQGEAPASLMFAAGFVASQASLHVASMPHVWGDGYQFADESDSRAVHRPAREAAPGRARMDSDVSRAVGVARRLGGRWWGALIGYSLAIGILLPVIAGALALLLEWFLAQSQSGAVGAADWGQLSLALAAPSILLTLSERLISPRLNRPSVSIVAAPTAETLARRVALIEPTTLSGRAAPLSEVITRQLGDIVAALPGVDDVTVDLGSTEDCPNGRDAVFDPQFGLRKSLRSTRPVRIRWNGKCTTTGPGTSSHEWEGCDQTFPGSVS